MAEAELLEATAKTSNDAGCQPARCYAVQKAGPDYTCNRS
jgi:hypothetical protein